MSRHRDLGINDSSNQVCPPLAALQFHHFGATFFHEARRVENGVLGIDLVRPVRHVGDEQRILHPAPDGLHVMQHLVHRDRERVLIPQHGLRQRIADQHHLDAGVVDQTRNGVIVSGKAGNGIVAEFLLAKRGGSYLIAGTVKQTAPEWSQTHDVLQCPSASGG